MGAAGRVLAAGHPAGLVIHDETFPPPTTLVNRFAASYVYVLVPSFSRLPLSSHVYVCPFTLVRRLAMSYMYVFVTGAPQGKRAHFVSVSLFPTASC